MIGDDQLLRRYAQSDDEDAFRELVSRYINLVYSTAVRQLNGDVELAKDVTQLVFTGLANEAKRLKPGVVLGGWIYRRTCFVSAKTVRTEIRRRRREQKAAELNMDDQESGADWKNLALFIDRAMQCLAAADRDAIILRFFEGRDLRGVGETLGISEQAAKKRVGRAVDKLRLLIKKWGMELSVATLGSLLTAHAVAAAPAELASVMASGALAAVAPAGWSFWPLFWKGVGMTKLKLLVSATVVSAILIVPITLQHRRVIDLETENAALRERQIRPDQPPQEPSQNAPTDEELANLRREHSELMRLRSEVALLRTAAIQQRSNAAPAAEAQKAIGDLSKDQWKDLGASNPNSALETLLWALRTGDKSRVDDLIQWQTIAAPGSTNIDFDKGQAAPNVISNMQSFVQDIQTARIVSSEPFSDEDGALVKLETTDGRNQKSTQEIVMARRDTGWKITVNVENSENQSGPTLHFPLAVSTSEPTSP